MASVSSGEETGWRSVVLESEALRVVVLPEKGAEIHRLVHRESGVDSTPLFVSPARHRRDHWRYEFVKREDRGRREAG
jgi:hypothetical protein